jgi:hypothetical protein
VQRQGPLIVLAVVAPVQGANRWALAVILYLKEHSALIAHFALFLALTICDCDRGRHM